MGSEIEDLRAKLEAAEQSVRDLTQTQQLLTEQKQIAEAGEAEARAEVATEVDKRAVLQEKVKDLMDRLRQMEQEMEEERALAVSEKLKAAKRGGSAGITREILRRWIFFDHNRAIINWKFNRVKAAHKKRIKKLEEDDLGPDIWEWESRPNTFTPCCTATSEKLQDAIENEEQQVGPLPLIDGLKAHEFGANVRFYPFRRLAIDLEHDKNFKIRLMKAFVQRKPVTTSGAIATRQGSLGK
eukprot:TRINITY_DN10976_c0_g1_i1.p1 TRINITY_DN10976_c0_g1~~TRINITY_DN10976_c0_g1_i1.p1  ORF type:complete len:241 (-),score=50.32 TRINITY_DN10976_c0_g1_i1:107-829(-)